MTSLAALGLNPVGLVVAFAAGAVSFLSPCFLPLVPGYIAFMSGGDPSKRLARVGLFVGGFALVFTGLGLGSGFLGGFLIKNLRPLEIAGGVLIALLGLVMVLPRVPMLERERRLHLSAPASNLATVGVGMAFAIGWSPCIGPTLAAALTLAATSGQAVSGGVLLFVFALGLGLPLLVVTLLFDRIQPLFAKLKLHTQAARYVAGGLLIAFGALMAIGTLGRLSAQLTQFTPFQI